MALFESSPQGNWLYPKQRIQEWEEEGSHTFYDLVLEATHHYFHHILLEGKSLSLVYTEEEEN